MTHPKVDDARDKMHKGVVHLQEQFASLRTGRAAPALVEKLKVDYYGSEVPLQQLAGFSAMLPMWSARQPQRSILPARAARPSTSCSRGNSRSPASP